MIIRILFFIRIFLYHQCVIGYGLCFPPIDPIGYEIDFFKQKIISQLKEIYPHYYFYISSMKLEKNIYPYIATWLYLSSLSIP